MGDSCYFPFLSRVIDGHSFVLSRALTRFCGFGLRTVQVSKAWEEVASVDIVGESIVIGRYMGGNITLKAAVASRRYSSILKQFVDLFWFCPSAGAALTNGSAIGLNGAPTAVCHTMRCYDGGTPHHCSVGVCVIATTAGFTIKNLPISRYEAMSSS